MAEGGRQRYRGKRSQNHHSLGAVSKDIAVSFAGDSPVLAMFQSASKILLNRQDRHERLVKLSRDITIESKRIIFLLHSATNKESTDEAVQEANERIRKLIIGPIKSIGLELENSPAYLHIRAVSGGFQEFVEAWTLCSLIQHRKIITWSEVQRELTYTVKENEEAEERQVVTMLPKLEYILGIADLTGEVMRRSINCISSGQTEECFQACQVLRDLYTGFLGVFGGGRELSRKMAVSRANVLKAEGAAYASRVRGGEAPPALLPMLLPTAGAEPRDAGEGDFDEGYY